MSHREVCLRSIPLKYPPMGSARCKECLYNCMNWGLPQTSYRVVPPLYLYLYLYYLKFTRDLTSLPTSSIASRCFGSCAIKSSLIFITWETGLSTLHICKKVHIVVNVTFLQKTFSVWWIHVSKSSLGFNVQWRLEGFQWYIYDILNKTSWMHQNNRYDNDNNNK